MHYSTHAQELSRMASLLLASQGCFCAAAPPSRITTEGRPCFWLVTELTSYSAAASTRHQALQSLCNLIRSHAVCIHDHSDCWAASCHPTVPIPSYNSLGKVLWYPSSPEHLSKPKCHGCCRRGLAHWDGKKCHSQHVLLTGNGCTFTVNVGRRITVRLQYVRRQMYCIPDSQWKQL